MINCKVKLPQLPLTAKIVIPISMNQPLQTGVAFKAQLDALKTLGHAKSNITILVCDTLNRHNCSESESMKQGNDFILANKETLQGYNIIRWQEFVESHQPQFNEAHNRIITISQPKSYFYEKIRKTWEKCLSAQEFQASLKYQREEYAAILCMHEFDYLIYPKRPTNGIAYTYSHFKITKPEYIHARINKTQAEKSQKPISFNEMVRPIPLAVRMALDDVETILSSSEISTQDKVFFADALQNLIDVKVSPVHSKLK